MSYHKKTFFGKRIDYMELSIFSHQMSAILKSDISIVEGLDLLLPQIADKGFRQVVQTVQKKIQLGQHFHQAIGALPEYFPEYFIKMVQLGEEQDRLADILGELSTYYSKTEIINNKIRSASAYPMLILFASLAVTLLLMMKIVPIFNDIIVAMGGEMPLVTKIILGVGVFLNEYMFFVFIAMIIIVIGIYMYINSYNGKFVFDRFILSVPFIKPIIMSIVVGRFGRSMSMMLRYGMDIGDAIRTSAILMPNVYIEERLYEAAKEIDDGINTADVLKDLGIFPPLFVPMIAIGEKSENFNTVLLRAAVLFEDDSQISLDKLINVVEPIIILVLGILVSLLLVAIIMPMLNMMSFL